MKLGVIVDDMKVAQWQLNALQMLPACDEIVFYNCRNSRSGKRRLKHLLYYALNLVSVRNPLTRFVPVDDVGSHVVRFVDFDSEHEGIWQRLPASLLEQIARDRPAAIVKFGLNLLRVPAADRLAAPILSFHHGDPEQYRGRPAGFWELLHGRSVVGQMVQILSDRLDAGAVVAYAETKAYAHSWRATLIEAYRASPLILSRAIENAVAGTVLAKPVGGRNYRLPGNATVLRFCARMARAAASRLVYGALREKRWQVATAAADAGALLAPDGAGLPPRETWRSLPCPRGYTFLADPFFAPGSDAILAEALHARSGKGEILRLGDGEPLRLSDPSCHYSYPGSVEDDGCPYVVPETVFWSPPRAYRWLGDRWSESRALDIAGSPRLIDPTFFRHESGLYLFANRFEEGSGVLRLWRAPALFARFEEHPASPVRITPAGSRMAGSILRLDGVYVRLGQDDSGGYGDGLMVFAIEEISPGRYRETLASRLRFEDVRGPHTLNFKGGTALFDWYRDGVSLFAGVRRLRGRRHNSSGLGAVSAPSTKGQNL
ncbi:MAG TPA: hypothetical protein VF702_11135 [Allosphingosinicella sp.]|jgi:hypothetical protein